MKLSKWILCKKVQLVYCVELQCFNSNIFFITDMCQSLIFFEIWYVIQTCYSNFIILVVSYYFCLKYFCVTQFSFITVCIFLSGRMILPNYCRISCLCFLKSHVGIQFLIKSVGIRFLFCCFIIARLKKLYFNN